MQMISITLRVLSRPDVNHLSKIYQSLGLDYDERVLPSIGNEVLKSIVAQFDAAELITQREVVSLNWVVESSESLHDNHRYHRESVPTFSNVPANSTSNWRMFPSLTLLLERSVKSSRRHTFTHPPLSSTRNLHKLSRLSKLPSKVYIFNESILVFTELSLQTPNVQNSSLRRCENHGLKLILILKYFRRIKSDKRLLSGPRERQKLRWLFQELLRRLVTRSSRFERSRLARLLLSRSRTTLMSRIFLVEVVMYYWT